MRGGKRREKQDASGDSGIAGGQARSERVNAVTPIYDAPALRESYLGSPLFLASHFRDCSEKNVLFFSHKKFQRLTSSAAPRQQQPRALRINLNIDGAPITSRTHTQPSHSQTSRLLTSSLSLGVPVPRTTQCM